MSKEEEAELEEDALTVESKAICQENVQIRESLLEEGEEETTMAEDLIRNMVMKLITLTNGETTITIMMMAMVGETQIKVEILQGHRMVGEINNHSFKNHLELVGEMMTMGLMQRKLQEDGAKRLLKELITSVEEDGETVMSMTIGAILEKITTIENLRLLDLKDLKMTMAEVEEEAVVAEEVVMLDSRTEVGQEPALSANKKVTWHVNVLIKIRGKSEAEAMEAAVEETASNANKRATWLEIVQIKIQCLKEVEIEEREAVEEEEAVAVVAEEAAIDATKKAISLESARMSNKPMAKDLTRGKGEMMGDPSEEMMEETTGTTTTTITVEDGR